MRSTQELTVEITTVTKIQYPKIIRFSSPLKSPDNLLQLETVPTFSSIDNLNPHHSSHQTRLTQNSSDSLLL